MFIKIYYSDIFLCDTDLAHIYSKFLGPLPLTAEEFILSVNKYFPHIIDTKMLLNSNNVLQQRMKKSSTSLSSAFSVLCPQIALGSKSSNLALQSCVKVEVEVDDMRSVFHFLCPLQIMKLIQLDAIQMHQLVALLLNAVVLTECKTCSI